MSVLARSLLLLVLLASPVCAQTPPQLPNANTRILHPLPVSTQPPGQASYASHTEPSPLATAEQPLPLRRADQRRALSSPASRTRGGANATSTVVGSLAIVLAAFFLVAWLTRKAAPKGLGVLPPEVVESLGRAPLTARQQIQLVRIGRKLVLLSVTANGVEALTEVTDAEEVDRLCGLCRQNSPGSISNTFRQVLSQYAQEPTAAGFAGPASVARSQRTSRLDRASRHEEDDRD